MSKDQAKKSTSQMSGKEFKAYCHKQHQDQAKYEANKAKR